MCQHQTTLEAALFADDAKLPKKQEKQSSQFPKPPFPFQVRREPAQTFADGDAATLSMYLP